MEKKGQVKIGFTGPQGSGKTTAAAETMADLRKKGYDAHMVTEVARSMPRGLSINKEATWQSQTWIFGRMICKELETKGDIIICDRTLADVLAYTMRIDAAYAGTMRPFIHQYMKTYDLIFNLPARKEYLIDDGIRSTDHAFQQQIDTLLQQEFDRHKETIHMYYITNHKERMRIILENLKHK
jgi:thymidylate kinase